MNEMVSLALAWAAGVLLGTMFFGGLWWTVHEGVTSKKPGLFYFASLAVRTVIALAEFIGSRGGPWGGAGPSLVFMAPDRDPPHPKG